MGLDSINSLLSSRIVLDAPVSAVGHHSPGDSAQQLQEVLPTLASAPHLFDSIEKTTTAYSVLVTTCNRLSQEPRLSEYEHKRIMKRISEEREKKERLTLFPEILRKLKS